MIMITPLLELMMFPNCLIDIYYDIAKRFDSYRGNARKSTTGDPGTPDRKTLASPKNAGSKKTNDSRNTTSDDE